MSYHHCSVDNLQQEADRRHGFSAEYIPKDKLIEYLKQDDDEKGSDATTVETNKPSTHETDPGQKELSSRLVNQSKHTTACTAWWCKKADCLQKSYTGP